MKKTYIEPKTTVVALNICDCVMLGGSDLQDSKDYDGSQDVTPAAREVIKTPDVWEEW